MHQCYLNWTGSSSSREEKGKWYQQHGCGSCKVRSTEPPPQQQSYAPQQHSPMFAPLQQLRSFAPPQQQPTYALQQQQQTYALPQQQQTYALPQQQQTYTPQQPYVLQHQYYAQAPPPVQQYVPPVQQLGQQIVHQQVQYVQSPVHQVVQQLQPPPALAATSTAAAQPATSSSTSATVAAVSASMESISLTAGIDQGTGIGELFKQHDLYHAMDTIIPKLRSLGVRNPKDLEVVEESDVKEMGLTKVDERKLLRMLNAVKGSWLNVRSLPIAGLVRLLNLLCGLPFFRQKEVQPDTITSEHIRAYLKAGGAHPSKLFPDCFSHDAPEAAVSYEWRLSLRQVLLYLSRESLTRCRELWGCTLPAVTESLRVWIDVFFIDQRAVDAAPNLAMAAQVYADAPLHFALVTDTFFTRAWCLFEIAVRYKAAELDSSKQTLIVESCTGLPARDLRSDGRFFQGMCAKVEEDKQLIRDTILRSFGTVDRFNGDMKKLFIIAGGKWGL